MVTFYKKGNSIIWDTEKNKVLCQFKDGMFKTKDTYIINMLKQLKYKFDEDKKTIKK